jgi:hypothetical protein
VEHFVDGVSGLCGRMQRVKKRANTAENRAKISRQSPAKTAKSGQNTVVFGNNAHFTHLSDIVTRQILSENTNTSVKLAPEIDITLAPILLLSFIRHNTSIKQYTVTMKSENKKVK